MKKYPEDWTRDVEDEHTHVVDRNVWTVLKWTSLPKDEKILSMKWVMKPNPDGSK